MKSIQIVGADFDSTIAANQLMPEVNTDFRYVVISRQNQGSNKIVTAIAPSFERRYLRSGDNNWFSCEKLSNHIVLKVCSNSNFGGKFQSNEGIESLVFLRKMNRICGPLVKSFRRVVTL